MQTPAAHDLTQLLNDASRGEARAVDRLLVTLYDELREIARRLVQRRRDDPSLGPTGLVHEAYLRLVDQSRVDKLGRVHFCNLAALAMRQILADHARRRRATKRGGAWQRISLGHVNVGASRVDIDVIALDDALTRLTQLDQRQGRIIELRFLAGLSVAETAAVLGVSVRTVQLDWRMARAWLRRQLGGGAAD